MSTSKKSFIFSMVALAFCILMWKDLYLFTKAKVYFPNWGHLLTLLALIPILFITTEKNISIKDLAIVVLGIPALAIAMINSSQDQFFARTIVNFLWVTLLNTIPVAIALGLIKLMILGKLK